MVRALLSDTKRTKDEVAGGESEPKKMIIKAQPDNNPQTLSKTVSLVAHDVKALKSDFGLTESTVKVHRKAMDELDDRVTKLEALGTYLQAGVDDAVTNSRRRMNQPQPPQMEIIQPFIDNTVPPRALSDTEKAELKKSQASKDKANRRKMKNWGKKKAKTTMRR